MSHAATAPMSFPALSDQAVATNLSLKQGVKKPPTTSFFVVSGNNMAADCCHSDGLFLVDHSLDLVQGCLVVAVLEGEVVMRRVQQREGQCKLKQPGTAAYRSEADEVWGVMTTMIHSVFVG